MYRWSQQSVSHKLGGGKKAAPNLRRSIMVGKSVNGSTNARRVSEQAWLNETELPDLDTLTNR